MSPTLTGSECRRSDTRPQRTRRSVTMAACARDLSIVAILPYRPRPCTGNTFSGLVLALKTCMHQCLASSRLAAPGPLHPSLSSCCTARPPAARPISRQPRMLPTVLEHSPTTPAGVLPSDEAHRLNTNVWLNSSASCGTSRNPVRCRSRRRPQPLGECSRRRQKKEVPVAAGSHRRVHVAPVR